MTTGGMRVLMIAPGRHPIRQPHAGGLEACVWERVRALQSRGHDVTLCAPDGSDFLSADTRLVLPRPLWRNTRLTSDTAYPPGHAVRLATSLRAVFALAVEQPDRFDVIDDHSLHAGPIAWSDDLDMPVVTTLHTPPLPPLVSAARSIRGDNHRFVAVSAFTAAAWGRAGVESTVLANGVDTMRWAAGPGGDRLVWFGRLVPEKAPHLAMDAARLIGRRIVLAGRVGDQDYFDACIVPRLGPDAEYLGALHQTQLHAVVSTSAVALVTPVWDEPFGMVIAEAMATGTPVAAFDSGGVGEVIGGAPGTALVAPGDVAALAAAADRLARASTHRLRARVRGAAQARHAMSLRHKQVETLLAQCIAGAGRREAA